VAKNIEEVHKKLTEYNESFNKTINNKNVWTKAFFKFSPTLKHNDVKLINEYTVKSSNSSGYKFAIMDPSLEKGSKIKTFSFKVKECSSNWVAVGMCHSSIVKNKSYAFNFSNLGHGGYLVSANGGSWSNTKSEANNTVKVLFSLPFSPSSLPKTISSPAPATSKPTKSPSRRRTRPTSLPSKRSPGTNSTHVLCSTT
jgi:hypothetical protein